MNQSGVTRAKAQKPEETRWRVAERRGPDECELQDT